ncbi:unnamed protein product [Prorocentrum cordatum]|uniref:Uncharacterized protein n=1 Tax=Prorocentrum cordatum TaxID=2364126 RepID=A0ABN9PXA7_9DINO|nr:unnamed protein product [Polarella glacialis]
MARYVLTEAGRESCLIIARLFREDGGRWGFQAIGTFSRGTFWKDALPDMVGIHRKAPRDLQLRGSSTMMFTARTAAAGPPPRRAAPAGAGRARRRRRAACCSDAALSRRRRCAEGSASRSATPGWTVEAGEC